MTAPINSNYSPLNAPPTTTREDIQYDDDIFDTEEWKYLGQNISTLDCTITGLNNGSPFPVVMHHSSDFTQTVSPEENINSPKVKQHKWTPIEDQQLLKAVEDAVQDAVQEDTPKNWVEISYRLSNRFTNEQCRLRYKRLTSTKQSTERFKWDADHEKKLIEAINRQCIPFTKNSIDWEKISKEVSTDVTVEQCIQKYHRMKRK